MIRRFLPELAALAGSTSDSESVKSSVAAFTEALGDIEQPGQGFPAGSRGGPIPAADGTERFWLFAVEGVEVVGAACCSL